MRPKDVALYALLCLVWGSTWLVIKVGYGGLGPFTVAALRFGLAGLAFVALVPALGARWPSGRREWGLALFVGAVMFGGDYGLIYWGEQWLDSGLTAVVFATMPLATALGAHVYLPAERLTPRKLGGVVLALVGVAALFADRLRLASAGALWPMLAILGAALCASATSLATKKHGGALHATGLNAPAMLVGAGLLLAAGLAPGERPALPSGAAAWGAVLYLAFAGSVVTFLIYFRLLKSYSATTMSFIAVFTPTIALALGFAVLDERPSAWTVVGAALVLGGVALATTARRVAQADPVPEREAA